MLTLIYTLAFTQLLTGLAIIILGASMLVLQHKIKRLSKDTDLKRAICEYEMQWEEDQENKNIEKRGISK